MSNLGFLVLIFLFKINLAFNYGAEGSESWTGRWFPIKPTNPSFLVNVAQTTRQKMGVLDPNCDDGKTNLTMDWNGSFEDYTCLMPRTRFRPNNLIDSKIEFENIPKTYVAPHMCMQKKIVYDQPLPSFGAHRPIWAIYGEYKFLPKQRWIHNLEHGGVVALYHPCADLREISLLKEVVKSCLRRYVISPSRDLSEERPLALVAWGVRYTMSTIYPNAVRQFIRERALKGPERTPKDGDYDSYLIEKSSVVSDFQDSNLCPEV